ncbi:hypothetical protein OWV82_003567 [Melia azedarach]|uniref:Uncharacterized protein n=1 Tax=Melia azedarach TaxID=155640 RepID=A0ACC1YNK3_MELAZ|nr:hypothetical protein OWV82_003567 [Melia azedarach]
MKPLRFVSKLFFIIVITLLSLFQPSLQVPSGPRVGQLPPPGPRRPLPPPPPGPRRPLPPPPPRRPLPPPPPPPRPPSGSRP